MRCELAVTHRVPVIHGTAQPRAPTSKENAGDNCVDMSIYDSGDNKLNLLYADTTKKTTTVTVQSSLMENTTRATTMSTKVGMTSNSTS